MASRLSQYSMGSVAPQHSTMQTPSQQMSTTSCLNACHSAYSSGQSFPLEPSTSLVVNTWLTASSTGPDGRFGGAVDGELARRAWEHARRRAEDGCIVLGSLHHSTPSLLASFVSALPLSVPGTFYTALNVLRPFLHAVTPYNPSTPLHNGFAATFSLSLAGDITSATLSLARGGINTDQGLLNVPAKQGYRAFDVFYYLLTSASSEQERQYLGLKEASKYALLRKSETYSPPSYLPTSDDVAQAEDFRKSLRAVGIKSRQMRNLLSTIAAILRLGDAVGFLVDQEDLERTCEEVGELLELNPEVLLHKCSTEDRGTFICALYESVVDWVITRANEAIRAEIQGNIFQETSSNSDAGVPTPSASQDDDNTVSISVVELPDQRLAKAASLRTVFDDSTGINAEMKEDGVLGAQAGASILREMREAVTLVEADLDINTGVAGKDREAYLYRRSDLLEKVAEATEGESFIRGLLYPVDGDGILLGQYGRFALSQMLESNRLWFHLCLHPSDDLPASFANSSGRPLWSAGSVSSQIRAWRLPEWANHRNRKLDFTADFDIDEFSDRYNRLGCQSGRDGVETWIMERGWSNGEVVIGTERVWIRESAWWEAESMLDMKPAEEMPRNEFGTLGLDNSYQAQRVNGLENPFFAGQYNDNPSGENLLSGIPSHAETGHKVARSIAPTTKTLGGGGDYGLGPKGDDKHADVTYYGELDPELADGKHIQVETITFGRRVWIAAAWAVTFWIPSFVLSHVGRMKRPDVRLAWREKVLLMLLILFINGAVVFWIVEFGNLLCPNWDKAWNQKEVSYHTGNNDYWVSFRGGVYDLSSFWKLQHSDTNIQTTPDLMLPLAGTDMSPYIVPPLTIACPGLVDDASIALQTNETLVTIPQAVHVSGPRYQPDPTTKLHQVDWYTQYFLPRMKEYYKGELVTDASDVQNQGQNDNRMWFILNSNIYDLTPYFYTLKFENNLASYNFFPEDVITLVSNNPGLDLTEKWSSTLNYTTRTNSLNCLDRAFYIGKTDFRGSARCVVNNYLLLAFAIVICATILVKFLAALQLGSKRRPAQQDKFVICQVSAYTEGEDSLRKGLDSLTALAYDNKRKLICVICDGMIVGAGNDRPTPKIVLDILGVDPKVDPPALPFKAIGEGNEQLNYGKVYSGLYEYEGNVVPYIVVVKVGKESEQTKSKPGNRGKRDSQVLLMSFLNRVHHRSPMNPLELEMFHQINNIIGVDPELYEYLFFVDADTKVKEDSLNRLVAACAHDAKIAGICGETSLENEERSWWTMIQVYEYYISHHLAKAFESLFGSVTCLPGCFCMYRLRTADKGRPLIISDKVVEEYADIRIDTLHKKNLFSLGEDRYLTTLMTKHFPTMSYKFVPDAYALTEAPAEWSVLLSQRRRWINSTIHNLAELVFLKDLCGFCCFSMRFVVFVDLFGTIILPATCTYLVYLIYRVASHTGQFPLISIIMIAAVYGLQAIIFIIKRQWQHIGWMIIYLMAYPIWSVVLPVYSFWKQDDFSWGSTRVVIGEKGNRQVVAVADEGFDPRSIPLQRWDSYAAANNLPGRRGQMPEKDHSGLYQDGTYEMDDMQSMYSSVKPASTILTGFPNTMYRPPPSNSPHHPLNRQSTFSRYTDMPGAMEQTRLMSMGGMSEHHQGHPYGHSFQSQDNLMAVRSPHIDRSRSPFAGPLPGSRPGSTVNLSAFQVQGPTNEAIIHAIRECLSEVDLDNVTKKQLKALTEQKLQCQLVGERRGYLDAQIDIELANM